MINLDEVREYFPYLKSGKIYFDHAAVSPLPLPVKENVDKYLYERAYTEINNYPSNQETIQKLQDKLAALLNTNSERIGFTKSVTDSINILAQGINWKSGDRIILNDLEFPANVYPFLNLKSLGVEIDFVQSKGGMIEIDQIVKLIKPNTKLMSISFVQFLTGYRSDLASLGELCKKNDIIFCVDAIQGAGILELDVQKMKIDFLTGGSHKWLMGLLGLGYFFISEELQSRISQKNVGWLSVEDEWKLLDYKLEFKKSAARFNTGTFSMIAIVALDASLAFFKSIGFKNIEQQILGNTKYFIDKLNQIGISPVLENVDENKVSGIIAFKSKNAEELLNRLKDINIIGSHREGLIRFSPHFYNTQDEIDILINELVNFEIKK